VSRLFFFGAKLKTIFCRGAEEQRKLKPQNQPHATAQRRDEIKILSPIPLWKGVKDSCGFEPGFTLRRRVVA
jgi:hypothetical protein